jgi:LuxR family maltose regulon positive regulatory protein
VISNKDTLPLISAKLSRPHVGRFFVRRDRLDVLLDRGLEVPVTLLSAPAGYGKTTLVSAWLERLAADHGDGRPLQSAWLSLDSRDNDLIGFMRYLVAAIRAISPNACAETWQLVGSPRQPPLSLLAATLSNDIATLSSPLFLVLDDYSAITNESIHSLFDSLLRHWPQPLRLILIARHDPPLALSRLRASGMLAEIRNSDLRFTSDEIASYLDLRALDHSDRVLDELSEATEGWIAGLQLTIRSVLAAAPHDSHLKVGAAVGQGANAAVIAGYLLDEVFSVQPKPIRQFLLMMALVERFNAALAAAVVGASEPDCDVQECMRHIQKADLFVTALDSRAEWLRFHHMFLDVLRSKMSAEFTMEQVNSLHERAAVWFGSQGHTDEAIHHALSADNPELATRIVERALRDALNREDPLMLERWLHRLPEGLVNSRPGLLLARAWVLQFNWQITAHYPIVRTVERILDADPVSQFGIDPEESQLLRAQVDLFLGQHAMFHNRPAEAIACFVRVLEHLPSSWTYARGGVLLQNSMSKWMNSGNFEIVRDLLDQYGSLTNQTNAYALRHLHAAAFISAIAGQLEPALQSAQVMLRQAERGTSSLLHNWALYFLGLAHLERGEFESAIHYFSELVSHPHTPFLAVLHDGFAGMMLTYLATGDVKQAKNTIDNLADLDLDRKGLIDDRTHSLRARLHLARGEIAAAGLWADSFTTQLPDEPMIWIEIPHLTKARVLLARNSNDDIAKALALLDALDDLALRSHSTNARIHILPLKVLALENSARREAAQTCLGEALQLARPGGHLMPFVELGPQMKTLLLRLRDDGVDDRFLNRLLAAFPVSASGKPAIGTGSTSSTSFEQAQDLLVEPLTPRELEILGLLQRHLSDQQIADSLVVSPATVRRHTANIYGKLGVHRRSDAVAQAISIGLLASP